MRKIKICATVSIICYALLIAETLFRIGFCIYVAYTLLTAEPTSIAQLLIPIGLVPVLIMLATDALFLIPLLILRAVWMKRNSFAFSLVFVTTDSVLSVYTLAICFAAASFTVVFLMPIILSITSLVSNTLVLIFVLRNGK